MRALRLQGCGIVAYGGAATRTTQGDVLPLEDYSGEAMSSPGGVLIYQHAMGWPQAERLVRTTRNITVIRYHNVTPASFYNAYSKLFESGCLVGAAATRRLARTPKFWFLPASMFNQDELVAAGAPPDRCQVLPPFPGIQLMAEEAGDRSVSRHFDGARTKLLFVSAMWPHKGHVRGLRILSEYRRRYDSEARLIFAGASDDRLAQYDREVHSEMDRLGLAGAAVFAKNLTAGQMRELYASADLLLCLSEHEGFGIPLVEAMHFSLPVIAWGTTAVPETLGDAGVLITEFDETVFAAAIWDLMQNPVKRRALAESGRARYLRLFDTKVIERQLIDVLTRILKADAHSTQDVATLPSDKAR